MNMKIDSPERDPNIITRAFHAFDAYWQQQPEPTAPFYFRVTDEQYEEIRATPGFQLDLRHIGNEEPRRLTCHLHGTPLVIAGSDDEQAMRGSGHVAIGVPW